MLKRIAAITIITFLLTNVLTGFCFAECIVPCPVYAEAALDADYFKEINSNAPTGRLIPGERLEILKDRSEEWYYVKRDNGDSVWVAAETIIIPENEETKNEQLSQEFLDAYVNQNGFESKTNMLVFTEIYRQTTHIFSRESPDSSWILMKSFCCTTGKNKSPTTRGKFTISDRGEWFYSERLGAGAKYWVRFNGTYLFHSVSMDKSKSIIDPTLGRRASSGCVRFGLTDAEWFYNNVPKGTAVYIT